MSEARWSHLVDAHLDPHPRSLIESADFPAHDPKVAVLACSDARVPPSVVFNQPAGNLFVIRIAGNTAPPAALASLDFAVAELGIELIVVLGHTGCGAVAAAMKGNCGGHLEPVVGPICALVSADPQANADQIAEMNVTVTMAAITAHDGPVGLALRSGQLEIRGALHELRSGQLIAIASPDLLSTTVPLERT